MGKRDAGKGVVYLQSPVSTPSRSWAAPAAALARRQVPRGPRAPAALPPRHRARDTRELAAALSLAPRSKATSPAFISPSHQLPAGTTQRREPPQLPEPLLLLRNNFVRRSWPQKAASVCVAVRLTAGQHGPSRP